MDIKIRSEEGIVTILLLQDTVVISNFVSSKIGKVKSTFFLKKQHCNFVVQTTKLQCYERDFQNQEVSNVEQS